MSDLPMFGALAPVEALVAAEVAKEAPAVEADVKAVVETVVDAKEAAVHAAIDKWFADHCRGSILARETDLMNHVFFGLDRLKAEVLAVL